MRSPPRLAAGRRDGSAVLALALIASIAAACARPAPKVPAEAAPTASSATGATGVERDVCDGSPPVPHELHGILRNARCDQDRYYSMSRVADMLGVQCTYCHKARPGGQGLDAVDYEAPTPRKEVANWMSSHLMASLKSVDGSPIRCSSCHTDDNGNPVAKILGEPRSRAKAMEWMSVVLVKKFVAADGSKLKCKTCHGGSPGTPEFTPKVILDAGRLPAHKVGAPGTPAL